MNDPEMPSPGSTITVSGMVEVASGTPCVHMELGPLRVQMSVEDARAHAMSILEAIAEAQSYAAISSYCSATAREQGRSDEDGRRWGVTLMQEVRKWQIRHEPLDVRIEQQMMGNPLYGGDPSTGE